MTDDMDGNEDRGVAVVGTTEKPAELGPTARRRGRARTGRAPGAGGGPPPAGPPAPLDEETGVADGGTRTTRSAPAQRARPAGRTTPLWVAVTLGAVSVVAVVLALLFGSAWSTQSSQNASANDAKAEASSFLRALTNFRPNTVDSDFATIMGMATGDFAKQAQGFFGSNIRQALEQARAQSDGQVRNIYVQSLDGNQAQVYAVVDQTYANSKSSAPATDVLRVVLNLTDLAGGWKVSEVSVLQAPSAAGAPSANASSAVPAG